MKSFSQYYQDKAIDFALNRKRNGIFLDIGAHDGVSLSIHSFLSVAEIGQGYVSNRYLRCSHGYGLIVIALFGIVASWMKKKK